jgi:hypothetical protein
MSLPIRITESQDLKISRSRDRNRGKFEAGGTQDDGRFTKDILSRQVRAPSSHEPKWKRLKGLLRSTPSKLPSFLLLPLSVHWAGLEDVLLVNE